MGDRIGQRVDDYLLIRFLGEGTFGDVYLGEHVYQKTPVAVKIFKTKLTPDKFYDFINEIRTVRLRHPNISQVLDFGIENDIPFLVMELAPGGTLVQRHPRGTVLPLTAIITYTKQIAAALQYAHDQRRIHRDVKPENILMGKNSEILLSDFGIAVVAHSSRSQKTEEALGTAIYMAPEQWQGKPLPATDQYALGIIVYEWLSGECPFKGNTLQLMYQHINVSPPPLHTKIPTISLEVEQAVMKALAKAPENRYPTVLDFANALEKAVRYPNLIHLHRCTLEKDDDSFPHGVVWSPTGKYLGVTDEKTVYIFDPHNGKRVFSCEHEFYEDKTYSIVWDDDDTKNVKPKGLFYSADRGGGYLINNLTKKSVLRLFTDSLFWTDGYFFPDKTQSEYWHGPFVESLKTLVGSERTANYLEEVSALRSGAPWFFEDSDRPVEIFYCHYCFWSPDLKYIAIPRIRGVDIYKVPIG